MASFSSVRAPLPATHGGSGLPAAALKAAARSGANFVVVCPAGDRAKAVVAALQAAAKGAGLVLSSRVVARASKRSAEDVFFVGDGEDRTGDEVDDVFFVGSGEERTGDNVLFVGAGEDRTGDDVFFMGAGDYSNGEEVRNGDTNFNDGFLVGAGSDRTANDSKDAVGEDITVRRGVMTRALPEGRVCWGFFPTAKRRLAIAYTDSKPKDFTGGRGVLSLAVPEGTNSGWAGLLPAANRHVKVVRCLSNSNESAAPLGKGSIWEPIPRAINVSALVGDATVLEGVAISSRRIISVINDFTPLLVNYVANELLGEFLPFASYSVLVADNKYERMGLVQFIQRRSFDIVSAVELVEAEAKEGYIREETLLGAILKVRDPANRFLSKAQCGRTDDLLPTPYAGTAPKEEDKVKHFLQMATELQGIAVALEAGLRKVQS